METKDARVVTLKEFLIENKDLLTIFGVFIAVAAFAGNLSIKFLAIFISISAITCAALIAFEIWKWSSKGKHTLTLTFFSVSLFVLTLSLLIYCFYFFDAVYPDILFPILTLLFAEFEVWLARKLSAKSEKVRRAIEWFKAARFWKFVIAFFIVIGTMFIVRLVTNQIEIPAFKMVLWIATVSNNIKGAIQ